MLLPSLAERRSTQLAAQAPRPPSSSARPRLPHRASKKSLSHASPKCARLWFPGKGTRNMAPQVSGLFYSCNLQASIAWWKMPPNYASKKVLRWVDHGVKVEFKKGLPLAPKPSAPKFVDPPDVDFAIQDLLKGRRIGAYQDLAPGGGQFQIKGSHSPGQGQAAYRACSLQPQRGNGQSSVRLPTRIFACSSRSSRKEVLCVASPSARAALRGSQESSSRRLRPPSVFLRGSHLVLLAFISEKSSTRKSSTSQDLSSLKQLSTTSSSGATFPPNPREPARALQITACIQRF
jgi:hypothetical protein